MRLVRHGDPGAERPGILDRDGRVRDLSPIVADIAGPVLTPRGIGRLRGIDPAALPLVPAEIRLGPCVGGVRHFIAIGANYADHAAESNMPVPKEPIVFSKAPSCIAGPNDVIVLPRGSLKTDWEVELAVVIGQDAVYVPEPEALAIVAGYCVCNDVSERDFQGPPGAQWLKGKSAPSFGPLGPWLATPDEIADVQALDLWLDVNGERMQSSSTRNMVFGVAALIAHVSQYMRLEVGDVITTGTPPGVGAAKRPPRFLRPGDVVELGVAGLGEQRQVVVAQR